MVGGAAWSYKANRPESGGAYHHKDVAGLKLLIIRGMQILAGMCDGARTKDGVGFDGSDAPFGHSVARQTFVSPKQLPICVKMCIKYKRQLPEEIVKAARIWKEEKRG